MQRHLFLILFLFVLFASCEDKKSAPQNNTAAPTEIAAEADSLEQETEKEKQEEKKKKLPEGPLLVQKEVIPFLTQYGKEHPGDRIRISTRYGNIDVELFHDTPLHRANFLFLIENDYFDNTFFHRVAEGFVIQGGNSDNPETNKKRHYIGDYLIPGEFDAGHRHVRGAFAAAKYSDQNVSKASSPYEFYIVQSEDGSPHLNNEHTVFGRVIDGMDVVDSINKVKVDQSEWPLRNIHMTVELLD